jgi:deazaflavin-dependent oxidoreductase (nitroreductase family)
VPGKVAAATLVLSSQIRRIDMRIAVASAGHSLQLAYLWLHQAVYRRTGGLVGHRLAGSPSLMLRTTGRRSGSPRTAVLIYARDGADFVLVASNDGQDRPPAWFLNVEANPAVGVQVARRRAAGRARVVEQGDASYPRLWKLVNDGNHRGYEGYQRRTTRPIPLVVVTPSGPLV